MIFQWRNITLIKNYKGATVHNTLSSVLTQERNTSPLLGGEKRIVTPFEKRKNRFQNQI